MSIVAISETVGSLGDQIGFELAQVLGYRHADREIISEAAERFGQRVTELRHLTEERPTFWEHFSETRRRYLTFVEAIVLEMAARDKVVLVGRGTTMYLQGVPHALRVRITAPEQARVLRVRQRQGLMDDAARRYVRQSDRERAARIKFIHHRDWEDPTLYDLVLNTAALTVAEATGLLREALRSERFQPTPSALAALKDRSLAALARAELLRHPHTAHLPLATSCEDGYLAVSGSVTDEALRDEVQKVLAAVPGVKGIRNEIVIPELQASGPYGA